MRSILPEEYKAAKAKLLNLLSTINTCSLTTDFWTSSSSGNLSFSSNIVIIIYYSTFLSSIESYVTVTCHFVTSTWELQSHVLTTYQVKMLHTGDNIAAELLRVANDWGIAGKVTCVVTDSASNMKAAIRATGWRHLPCIAHTLNLSVQESVEQDCTLSALRQKARSIVTFFKQSTKAKDKLAEIQVQTNGQEKKLIRDVVT